MPALTGETSAEISVQAHTEDGRNVVKRVETLLHHTCIVKGW
jgi:hypothetical protein